MYFDRVLLTALGSPQVKRVEQVRREHDATGRIGFMRYRLTLINDDLVELTERVEEASWRDCGDKISSSLAKSRGCPDQEMGQCSPLPRL